MLTKAFNFLGIIIFIIITALLSYYDFFNQVEYLENTGRKGDIVFFLFIALTILKIAGEIAFFLFKDKSKKIVSALFVLVLMAYSIHANYTLRDHFHNKVANESKAKNQAVLKANQKISNQIMRLEDQLVSINEQIQRKNRLLNNKENGTWLNSQYNKQIDKLNQEKLLITNQINKLEDKKIVSYEKKIVIAKSHFMDFFFVIMIEFSILFSNLLISVFIKNILNTRVIKENYQPKSTVLNSKQTDKKVVSIERGEVNLTVNSTDDNLLANLKDAIKLSGLSKEKFAKEKLGITKTGLWKIETGQTKTITPEVKEKIESVIDEMEKLAVNQ